MSPFTHTSALSVVSMSLVSITFSLRSDKALLAMLDLAWQKHVYANEIHSVIAIQEGYRISLIQALFA